VGSQDLGFGTGTVYSGLAVTSSDNSKLATATFDTYEQSVPLPITLVSFSAINVHNEYVSIKWTTSMEQNNDYFLVEHSTDGLHFETLSTVKSSGNSIVNQDYIIADNHPAAGLNYYRIKQYDSDGKTSLYPVAIVKFGGGTAPTAFPNPVSSVLNVSSGEEIIQSIGLYDLLGKEILVTNNSNSNAVVKLKMISLSSGVYILKITTPSKVYEQKIMKE
jgi:Secretion system C-terminal sorting domain